MKKQRNPSRNQILDSLLFVWATNDNGCAVILQIGARVDKKGGGRGGVQ